MMPVADTNGSAIVKCNMREKKELNEEKNIIEQMKIVSLLN